MLSQNNKINLKSKYTKSLSQVPSTWGGAGVLPFARANNPTNDIYLLLGKEDIIPNWKSGSNKWCDFSGGKEEMDLDIEDTAARELYEESLAVPPLWEHLGCATPISTIATDKPRMSEIQEEISTLKTTLTKPVMQMGSKHQHWQHFAERLRQNNYTYRFDRTRPDSRCSNKNYTCFLVEVPFCPNVVKEFDKIRGRLLKLRKLSRCWHEKLQEINQMKDNDVRDVLMTFLPGKKFSYNPIDASLQTCIGATEPDQDVMSAKETTEHGTSKQLLCYYLANVYLTPNIANVKLLSIDMHDLRNPKLLDIEKDLNIFPAHIREKICDIIQCWTHLLEEFRGLPYAIRKHPAIYATRVPNSSYISNITVLDCYMEKQSIKWWSIPWLSESVQNGGAFRMELFRGPFTPFLSVVLDLFSGASHGRFVVDVRPWTSSSTFGNSLKKFKNTDSKKSNKPTNLSTDNDDNDKHTTIQDTQLAQVQIFKKFNKHTN